jgi:phosphinothricin acetyltransferase
VNIKIIDCTHDEHAGAILEILNDAIAHSTALYEYRPRSLESMRGWFEVKTRGHHPVLGALDEGGALLGFASYGSFRPHAAYKYSIEHSVYVEQARRGQGIGEALLRRLIERAGEQQFHVMIGGIDQENRASIALHEKLGFEHAGTIRQAGFKFGRWLDLAFYRRQLPGPDHPVDG